MGGLAWAAGPVAGGFPSFSGLVLSTCGHVGVRVWEMALQRLARAGRPFSVAGNVCSLPRKEMAVWPASCGDWHH